VDNSQLLKTIDLSAPLPWLADQALTIILDWVGYNLELSSSRKTPKDHEIPRDALREAIVNALIHRKYFLPDAVKIAVYADRVEIYSPGNLPGLIGDLRSGTSYPRYPHLRQIARKHNLGEKRGLGLNLIFDSCQKSGNLEPKVLEVYGATKAAVSGLTRCLAMHYGPKIRVNAVAPGFTPSTEMGTKVPAERAKGYIENSLTKKELLPESVAEMVCYLMSSKAINITGVTYEICNGTYLR
jgi:predicted HTH transcriptional regulator